MKAVILQETRKVVVGEVPDAEMRETTDVLLRLTSTAICGTDLDFYEGPVRGLEGRVISHAPLGLVQEVGSAVKNVKKGDRVTAPTHICCCFCAMCAEGHTVAQIRGISRNGAQALPFEWRILFAESLVRLMPLVSRPAPRLITPRRTPLWVIEAIAELINPPGREAIMWRLADSRSKWNCAVTERRQP